MSKMGKHRPESKLGPCVSTLKSLSRNLSYKSPSHIADVYLAAIGLLCHLKIDQATLQASWSVLIFVVCYFLITFRVRVTDRE